ncbi:NAD-dependent epimerase/dehydratase family protein [Parapusillimonas sp. JC17]|uniref:NAD-dependent epimerase/dehydratase family protein n=1 Tax=Parapusillimonas sp. JC17 TaxID=3445768 RepID=UPI003FA15060
MSTEHFTVLGSRGFIGSHLVQHFARNDLDYRAPHKNESLGTESLGHVIYCIGLTADFRLYPLDTVEAHVCVLRQLLARGNFTSLTYLSSTRVYTGSSETHERSILSVNPNTPGDLYNLSKLLGESLCLHGGHPLARVVRLSNIVGVRPDPDTFIDQLLEEARSTGHIHLQTSLDSNKDYLYIDDAVQALTSIAASPAQGIINVASGHTVSNLEIIGMLSQHMGFSFDVAPNATSWEFKPIDTRRLRTEFHFTPRSFDDYFPEFLRQYRNTKGLS